MRADAELRDGPEDAEDPGAGVGPQRVEDEGADLVRAPTHAMQADAEPGPPRRELGPDPFEDVRGCLTPEPDFPPRPGAAGAEARGLVDAAESDAGARGCHGIS